MSEDESQIRNLVSQWHSATKTGDVAAVLGLMTDDVVFLTPGREPMGKAEFAALSVSAPGAPRPEIDIKQDVHEVHISGSLAFMRSSLQVNIKLPGTSQLMERTGNTLTVLKKINGKWLLARDANLLTQRSPSSPATKREALYLPKEGP